MLHLLPDYSIKHEAEFCNLMLLIKFTNVFIPPLAKNPKLSESTSERQSIERLFLMGHCHGWGNKSSLFYHWPSLQPALCPPLLCLWFNDLGIFDVYVKETFMKKFQVPVGTVVKCDDREEILADLASHGNTFVVATGGIGGYGNANFKSSTNQAPMEATVGIPGEEATIELEMKSIADVGLVSTVVFVLLLSINVTIVTLSGMSLAFATAYPLLLIVNAKILISI